MLNRTTTGIITFLLTFSCLIGAAVAERRVALVIGNATYKHVSALPNTLNDASDISASLERLGFSVTTQRDLAGNAMRRALHKFSHEARAADIALIYFAGHGIEVGKRNYLVPTDAKLRSSADVDFEAIPLDLMMATVSNARGLRLVLLDACRNNPFVSTMSVASRTRAVGRGLVRVEPTDGTLVGFAAREGTTADDGKGRNSPYAAALLAHLEQPGLELSLMFRKVRDHVLRETDGAQEPFTYGSLPGKQIYLKAPEAAKPAQLSEEEKARLRERVAWNLVKDSGNLSLLRNYVAQYSDGLFRKEASTLIGALEADENAKRVAHQKAELEAEERARLASLQPSAVAPKTADNAAYVAKEEEQPDPRKLALSIQRELNRVGCNAGRPDGDWGRNSRRALQEFARHGRVRLAGLNPSQDVLDSLTRQKSRICPLVCGRRQIAKGNRCVLKTCPSGQELARSGICVVKAQPRQKKIEKKNVKRADAPKTAKPKATGKQCGFCNRGSFRAWACDAGGGKIRFSSGGWMVTGSVASKSSYRCAF